MFEPKEIIQICGEAEGRRFNQYFDITDRGNFEGKSIPNLLKQNNKEEWIGTNHFDLLMREGGRTVGSGRVATIIE